MKNFYYPNGNEPRTVAMWMRETDGIYNSVTVFKYGGDYSKQTFGAYFLKAPNGNYSLYFQGFGNGNDFAAADTYNLKNLIHIAVTYDGQTVKLYVNGVEKWSLDILLETTPTNIFDFGVFNGSVDDLRIYRKALTSAEISELYNNPEVAEFCGVSTSIGEEIHSGVTATIYPNPASTNVKITGVDGAIQYSVYGLSGRLLMAGETGNGQSSIDVSQLNPGYYMLNINNNQTFKLIIKR